MSQHTSDEVTMCGLDKGEHCLPEMVGYLPSPRAHTLYRPHRRDHRHHWGSQGKGFGLEKRPGKAQECIPDCSTPDFGLSVLLASTVDRERRSPGAYTRLHLLILAAPPLAATAPAMVADVAPDRRAVAVPPSIGAAPPAAAVAVAARGRWRRAQSLTQAAPLRAGAAAAGPAAPPSPLLPIEGALPPLEPTTIPAAHAVPAPAYQRDGCGAS
eukprot:scaffold1020_cov74-Phaeocystis_antarctica.AAC.3